MAENYLHPIEQFRNQPNAIQEQQQPPSQPSQPKRIGLFSANSKKKIGPIEDVTLKKEIMKSNEFLKETSLSTPPASQQQQKSQLISSNSAFSLKSKFEDSDIIDEQKGFVMLPSKDKISEEMEDIETNARRILNNLGITSEMLVEAIPSGPRSDIIGAYRIIVHRLQRQALLVKQAESIVIEEPPKPKNTRKVCVIL